MIDAIILYPEHLQLVEEAEKWEYGSIHTHEEIARILRLPANSHKYYSAVQLANKKLLDKQKILKVVRKIGYEVMKPAGYTEETIRQMKLSHNRMREAVKIANLAPIDKMNAIELAKHRAIQDRIYQHYAMTAGVVTEVKLLQNKR